MKSREVFSFIAGLFADGTLPEGRNLWGCAYNIDRYPGALHAAASHGMSEYDFKRWLLEYARRSKTELPLILPVVVRWGENDRPERTRVGVPLYTMKDFDSLPEATEAALMLELDAAVDAELYMRDMRAPDVPDVWARIEVNGLEKEVRFNPLKMWRGEEKLIRGGCDLKQVRVLEWRVVGDESGEIATRCADTPVAATPEPPRYDIEPQTEWPSPQTNQNKKQESWIDIMPKWLQNFFFVLGAAFWIFVALKGCEPEPPRFGDRVEMTKKCTAWSDPDAFAQYDIKQKKGERAAARKIRKEQREMYQIRQIPSGAKGKVIGTGAKCADAQDGIYIWVLFDDGYGSWWVRSSAVMQVK